MTRTHTVYVGRDTLAPVIEAIEKLAADWAARRPYMSAEVAEAGELRLAVAKAGIMLLAEPVADALT